MSKKITISIVTYNAEKDISACLNSLKSQTFQNFDLIIVDNGSTDKTKALVESLYPAARYIESGANIGFGAAHNIAIASSSAEWVLVLNADTELIPTALESLLNASSEPTVAAIGGILYCDSSKSEVDSTGIVISPLFYHAKERKSIPESNDSPWGLTGACVLLRKSALESIAYKRDDREFPEFFDEKFFVDQEDLDLAARLNKQGWKALFIKKEIGVHARTGAVEKSRQQLPEYVKTNSYKNHFYFLLKHADFYAIPFITAYETAKFFYLLLREPKTLAVIPEVIKNTPSMLKRRYV